MDFWVISIKMIFEGTEMDEVSWGVCLEQESSLKDIEPSPAEPQYLREPLGREAE